MDKYIDTKGLKLIFKSGDNSYPYLLEITEFVKHSNNFDNYDGQRKFALLDKNFVGTGDHFEFSKLERYLPNCELLHTK